MCFFLGHKNLEYPLGVRDVEEFGDECVCPGCSCHVCSSMDEMAVLYSVEVGADSTFHEVPPPSFSLVVHQVLDGMRSVVSARWKSALPEDIVLHPVDDVGVGIFPQ